MSAASSHCGMSQNRANLTLRDKLPAAANNDARRRTTATMIITPRTPRRARAGPGHAQPSCFAPRPPAAAGGGHGETAGPTPREPPHNAKANATEGSSPPATSSTRDEDATAAHKRYNKPQNSHNDRPPPQHKHAPARNDAAFHARLKLYPGHGPRRPETQPKNEISN
jgi:hypothetical protein